MSAVQDEDKIEQLTSKKDNSSTSQPVQPDSQEHNSDSDLTRPSQSQPGSQSVNPPEPAVDWSAEDDLLFPSEDTQAEVPPPENVNSYLPDLNYPTPPNSRRGDEIPVPPPPGGTGGTPLPRRVDEIDINATRVTPSVYTPPPRATGHILPRGNQPVRTSPRPSRPAVDKYAFQSPPPPPPPVQTALADHGAGSGRWKTRFGCLVRLTITTLFIAVILLVGAGSFLVYQYFSIASALPSVDDLRQHASQFETTRILDRNKNVLYEVIDPNAGRRNYVTLDKISPYLIATTLATEDKDFYTNPGFDPLAILRALWQNYTSGNVVSGASTITQQLARTLLLSSAERTEQTVQRKAREIVLASEITRRYSKEEILELYLNENNYSNMAYGIEAASETYFSTTADKLTLGQAAFLAGLPQAPAVYNIFSNRDGTLARQKQVLVLSYQVSQEKNCIFVGNNIKAVCIDASAATSAAQEIEQYKFKVLENNMRYPHWVNYIISQLEAQYGSDTIYRSGFTVYTTLDPGLQDQAEQIVKDQVDSLAGQNVQDGALVAMRPSTGEILAMVGSADFNNEAISGQINMAISPRQPGSSMKPLTYTAAFELGWTPSTLIWDVPSEFPPSGNNDDQRPPYVPVNYDGQFHGPVTVRTALANSYNIPAVKTLQFVGIYPDQAGKGKPGFISFAQRMGITTLTRNDYGLSLTLGGGEVTLLEMTGAYGVFADAGRKMPPVSITKIVDYTGNVVYEYKAPAGEQVISPEHAYLMSSILSDNTARTPAFGSNSVLNLPFQAAVKTGTTNDFRDNWTIGYTPDLVVGTWIGNADYTPMVHSTGVSGAAPIWAAFFKQAEDDLTGGHPTPFSRPAGIVERVVCELSGTEPSEWCPTQRNEVFASNQLPPKKENDLWQKIKIDTWTGLKASSACSEFTDTQMVANVTDPWAIKWLQNNDVGKAWAEKAGFPDPIVFTPKRECNADDPHATVQIPGLDDGQTITSVPLDIYAMVDATDGFKQFSLQYGKGSNPGDWKTIKDGFKSPVKQPEQIYSWDMKGVKYTDISLRIHLDGDGGRYAEKQVHLLLNLPTPTPVPTRTPTSTRTPSNTPTDIPQPTDTPEPPATATATPSETPSVP
jgi:penicillin-binding protein 1C